jgi:cobalt-zinc-cadmium efflux system outer membrane protein
MRYKFLSFFFRRVRGASLRCVAFVMISGAMFGQGPVRITLDDAIQLAIQHNHNLLAARTTIQQSEAQEITANLKPNPVFFTDWEYLPFFTPSYWNTTYIGDSTEADAGLSYLFERGQKRARRYQAAKDVTTITRSQVADNERVLTFQVATLFIGVELAESTLDLARENLKSYQDTVELSELRFKKGAISEDDYLKIDLQLLQFQNDVAQAELATAQSLSDLRNLLGYESVPANYDVAGVFDHNPMPGKLEDFQAKAMQNRPDYRAAQQGVTGANSQYLLAKANGKQDVTVSGNYSHVNGINAATFLVSVPLAIHNRNQGEIARTQFAITQSQQLEQAANNQVLTDVRDAYEGLQASERILQLYRSGYLERAKKDRDISEYAYKRGAVSLLDFLDAERSYRTTQLGYRQAIASGLLAEEQLRQAVGTRSLP